MNHRPEPIQWSIVVAGICFVLGVAALIFGLAEIAHITIDTVEGALICPR